MTRFLVFLAAWITFAPVLQAEKLGPDIYDTRADGKKLISEALTIAKKENKHVLLQFGANWCPWCHRLDELFKKNAAIREKLAASYVVILIDVNEDRNEDINRRYGQPTLRGLPVLVVLDADGNQIFTQETGALEKGEAHDPAKVLAFLNKW